MINQKLKELAEKIKSGEMTGIVEIISEVSELQGLNIVVICHPTTWSKLTNSSANHKWLVVSPLLKEDTLHLINKDEKMEYVPYRFDTNYIPSNDNDEPNIASIAVTEKYQFGETRYHMIK